MPVLFPELTFRPDETPLSYATRLAALHTRGRLVPFLNDMGIKAMALVGGELAAVQKLCAVSGTELTPVLRNTLRRVGKRRFDLRGHLLTSEFLTGPDTVFCPACLREDDETGGRSAVNRAGRLAWMLRPVRTCPIHNLPLVRRPRDRWDDQFHELSVRVPEQGAALEDIVARLPPRPVSPLQDYVTARLEGEAGPEWLDAQPLETAVRAAEMLGVLVAFGADKKLSEIDEDGWDQAGRAGFARAAEGEDGIRAALFQAQDAFKGVGKPARAKVFGAPYKWMAASKTRHDPGDLKRIFRTHIFETTEIAAGEEVLGETLDRRRLHSVESLARENGLDARTLRKLLVARGIVQAKAPAEGHHLFDAAAGEEVAATAKRAVHVISLPKALNCTRPQADQLVNERLVTPLADGRLNAPGRTQKAIDADSVAALLRALEKIAPAVSSAPSGYVAVAKAAEKAKTTSVAIVQLILAGFLQNLCRLHQVDGLSAILVDPVEVKRAIADHVTGISPSEAFGALRIPVATGWALADRDQDPCLRPIVIEGPSGHRFVRFDPEEVRRLRRDFTTESRIASDVDLPSKEVVRRLKVAAAQPIIPWYEVGLALYRISDLSPCLRPR